MYGSMVNCVGRFCKPLSNGLFDKLLAFGNLLLA